MKKESIILITVTLTIGFFVGLVLLETPEEPVTANQATSAKPKIDYHQKAQVLSEVVEKEPKNHDAWVQLGNIYYEADHPIQAIKAYGKALELSENDPDVLTAQGAMFRQVGWSEQAINNFKKANKLDPNHTQSLYNLGLAHRDDFDDKIKAKEAWLRYLELVPSGQKADKVRTMIEHMEQGHG